MMFDNDEDDFVKTLKNVEKKTKENKKCCTWKKCWISTCVSWLLSSIAIGTITGVLISQNYIEFHDPYHTIYHIHHPDTNTSFIIANSGFGI